jgi:hypothetical protein
MVNTVHQRNGNLFPVLTHIVRRLRDITFLPRDTEIVGHSLDHLPCVVAQVTSGTAEQRDSRGPGRGTSFGRY